jgi:Ser/Thr protein kinase RdoA (MazF antagonist)
LHVVLSADVIADAFGLGEPSEPLRPLAGGSSASHWRIDTARGRWVVKVNQAPAPWLLDQMRVACVLEQAAYDAGVPMPRPVVPQTTAIGLWARLPGDGCYARVSEWVDGRPPTPADTASLAGWLGRTLAIIERLGLPGDPTVDAAYPVHDVAQWSDWLDQGAHAGVLDRPLIPGLRSAVRDGTGLIQSALAEHPSFQLAHRDVSQRNILLAVHGPVLVDFDYAGPEVPWWEFVHHAFDLASPALGHLPPAADCVQAALVAYTEAGAPQGPAGSAAFAGMVRAALNATAYNLWLAVGQRPADHERRAAAARVTRDLAQQLPVIIRAIDAWTAYIRT